MKILLTGVSGQLGQELLPRLQRLGTVTGVDQAMAHESPQMLRLDLGNPAVLRSLLDRLQPDLLVNAAAYTAVDRAEAEPEVAFRVNAGLPECLAHWTQAHQSLLLHYSTDYVFSGKARRPYRETDATGPLNVYGESKLAGEQAISASGCRHLVLRTSWVYSARGNNFLLTMLRLARERSELRVVADQQGRPTWARNLALATVTALQRVISQPQATSLLGTWHYCDSDAVSWYDFALAIVAAAQTRGLLPGLPRMIAVTSGEFPQAAERPRFSVLDTSALSAAFGIEPAGLQSSLNACLEDIQSSV